MTVPRSRASDHDPDAAALRRTSRSVGLQLALASTVLVVFVVVAAFAFVLAHLDPAELFRGGRHESTIDIGGLDIIVAAVAIGLAAIAVAGLLSWFATRRAIRPLGDALRLQRSFVANASHELRTPLAVLDARLQYLQRGLAIDDPTSATVAELRRDARTLVQIVNDLLVSAEDSGGPSTTGAAVEMEPVVELAVESIRLLAADRRVTITLECVQVGVQMSAASIHRSTVALLENALRFAPEGSNISVTLSETHGSAELRVSDSGPGITGIAPSQVFERFARGQGGTQGATGFGIGLALVRDTVTRLGGTASVEQTGAGGTTMLLRIPRVRRK